MSGGAIALPTAVMLLLGLWGIDRGSMWRDESASYQIARRTLPQIWHMLGHLDAVHGLYYVIMHGVLSIRADEVTLRMPSVIAAAATAGLVAAIGARLARPRVGLWAGLIYACTPFVSHYAQEGRSYALVAAAAALATQLLVTATDRSTLGWWTGYAAAVFVTAMLHELALLILVAHGVSVLLVRSSSPVRRAWAVAAATVIAALLPLFVLSARQSDQISWIQKPGAQELRLLAVDFAGPSTYVLVGTFLLVGVALLRPLHRIGPLGLTAVALPLTFMPVATLLLVSLIKPTFVDRYLLFAFAGIPLLAAAGLERLFVMVQVQQRRSIIAAAAGVVLIAVAFWCQFPFHVQERTKESRIDDLHEVAALVESGSRPHDAVLFVPAYQRHIALTYHREFAGLSDIALKTSAAESGTLYGEEDDARVIKNRIGMQRRIWVVAWPGAWSTDWFQRDPKITSLRKHFRLMKSTQVKSGLVQLYVRR